MAGILEFTSADQAPNEHQEPAMSETAEAPVTNEPTVAEKRKVLQDAGVAVGSRGKLSADHEAEYQRLTAQA